MSDSVASSVSCVVVQSDCACLFCEVIMMIDDPDDAAAARCC